MENMWIVAALVFAEILNVLVKRKFGFGGFMTMLRSELFVFAVLFAMSVIMDKWSTASVLLTVLLSYIISSAISQEFCCPVCGRRYGLKIWFSKKCPRCGSAFERAENNEI
ncbi:MAG: hypothetical protein PUD43_10520 [Clostridia bacterium]|nr:hypothetical protein [Clostridia bacterium]